MFISTAYAQSAGGSADQGLLGFLPIILMFVVLWFLMIRPQMKRAKEHKAMLESLKKGDEVVTSGGVVGRVTRIGEAYVTLEVARNPDAKGNETAIEMNFQRGSIQTLLPTGTLKSL